jgi:uncharacterized membrane protein
MLAVGFTEVVVAIHVMAVVAGLGVVFAYPVLMPWMRQHHASAMPALHDAQDVIGRRLMTPGLVVILIAGIYLASKEDVWSKAWVSVPLLILIVIGGLGGAYFTPKTRRLAELSRRDLQRGSELSGEYDALFAQVRTVGLVMAALVLIAIFFMVAKPGA